MFTGAEIGIVLLGISIVYLFVERINLFVANLLYLAISLVLFSLADTGQEQMICLVVFLVFLIKLIDGILIKMNPEYKKARYGVR
jgi:hypothetical protein